MCKSVQPKLSCSSAWQLCLTIRILCFVYARGFHALPVNSVDDACPRGSQILCPLVRCNMHGAPKVVRRSSTSSVVPTANAEGGTVSGCRGSTFVVYLGYYTDAHMCYAYTLFSGYGG